MEIGQDLTLRAHAHTPLPAPQTNTSQLVPAPSEPSNQPSDSSGQDNPGGDTARPGERLIDAVTLLKWLAELSRQLLPPVTHAPIAGATPSGQVIGNAPNGSIEQNPSVRTDDAPGAGDPLPDPRRGDRLHDEVERAFPGRGRALGHGRGRGHGIDRLHDRNDDSKPLPPAKRSTLDAPIEDPRRYAFTLPYQSISQGQGLIGIQINFFA